ncbi:MAG: undecaprenyldiphospho-muramoylpentapeptide beta-N-acetylglucosaminyltransferase, partial [Eggerthellaceae bacterium]|nr:undecaprenyldiphospho-muramoylpentapeptide beta-N-acetylglucosaminyltransferase [Eggerthellaceae bacterium]
GPKEYDTVCEQLDIPEELKDRWTVVGYEDHMGDVLAACDCVVSRSGATSLAEISALGIPALLVPFPYATADHQTTNAREYVDAGAAYMIADDQVESPEFADLLAKLVDDASVREGMHAAAAAFQTTEAAGKLADVVIGATR